MNEPILTCHDEQRRQQIRQQWRNGLDYVEVSDRAQTTLCVHFLGTVPRNLGVQNLRIEGGQRIRDLRVIDIYPKTPKQQLSDDCLKVYVDRAGDFSTYTLRVVQRDAEGNWIPHADFDPRYDRVSFSFKVNCPSDLDCKVQTSCPPNPLPEPEINYLAKDYASFRQLILDRLALTLPDWQERHIPHLGITLVELLAYVGDYLSYYQDAVATEAYLETARQRISVRRHVRLVDYPMHEGCNARTWVWLELGAGSSQLTLNPQDFFLITRYASAPPAGTVLTIANLRGIPSTQYDVFEPIAPGSLEFYAAHNRIRFYTWGDRQCCLPQGATTATLLDAWIPPTPAPDPDAKKTAACETEEPPPVELERQLGHLKPGDLLIFAEVKGAKTDNPADADPTRRHVVRLTRVHFTEDTLYQQEVSGGEESRGTPVVEIAWAISDALPFPLCLSAIGPAPDCALLEDISVAHGNVFLADDGRTITPPEDLGIVETATEQRVCEKEGQPADLRVMPKPFRPAPLKYTPLTFREPLSTGALLHAPAATLLNQNPRNAIPQILALIGIPADSGDSIDPHQLPDRPDWQWHPQRDLLSSHAQDQHVVVEMDDQQQTHLRFGNDELGKQPDAGTHFFATYRIGNSTAGNLGAEALTHLVLRQTLDLGTTLQPHNPLPARGGTAPEPLAEVKLYAPHTFRKALQRAITAQDYADLVMRDFADRVQQAGAILRWTGSWYEVAVAIDPLGSETVSEALLQEIRDRLYRYRRIGHDLVVQPAVYVPLEIAMTVCVHPDYLRGHVKAALLDAFSSRTFANGQRGFFHPDNLTFGTRIALSQLVATAAAVTGVENVVVTRLQRLNEGSRGELTAGILPIHPLEIARLSNDSNFPEYGKLTLDLRGGR